MTLDEQVTAINVQALEVELLLTTALASLNLGAYQDDHAHVAATRDSLHIALDRKMDLQIAQVRLMKRKMQGG